MRMPTKITFLVSLVLGATSFNPVGSDVAPGWSGPAEACGQIDQPPSTGTCCYEFFAICVTPTGNIPNHYFKGAGRCSE